MITKIGGTLVGSSGVSRTYIESPRNGIRVLNVFRVNSTMQAPSPPGQAFIHA